MLGKPVIPYQKIAACLQEAYGLSAVQPTFLPLGADLNTAIYHIQTPNKPPLLLKLRSGPFHPASVTLPRLLHDQGVPHIIAPLPTIDGRLWTTLDHYKAILFPYIEGQNAYEVPLSDQQWIEFGAALKHFHIADLPTSLTKSIRQESYSPQWRDMVKDYLAQIETGTYDDPIAAELAAYLKTKRTIILDLIQHSEQHLQRLQTQSPPFIVCHADIHAGNLHIADNDTFYIIDWDTLILAPKERDLMSIGGGLMGHWRTPEEEITLFYTGYSHGNGPLDLNNHALTYYRCERIIEDIAVECRQIFYQQGSSQDRRQALYWLKSNFQPGNTISLAYNKG